MYVVPEHTDPEMVLEVQAVDQSAFEHGFYRLNVISQPTVCNQHSRD